VRLSSVWLMHFSPTDVIDGDAKMVMGMIWTLVLDSGVRKPLAVGTCLSTSHTCWLPRSNGFSQDRAVVVNVQAALRQQQAQASSLLDL
jgi:hypothetical protein